MLVKLSQKQKVVVDYALAALGAFLGNLVGRGIIDPIAGAFVGFFVSDLITYIDTGKVPVQDIEEQVIPLIQQEIAKSKTETPQKPQA